MATSGFPGGLGPFGAVLGQSFVNTHPANPEPYEGCSPASSEVGFPILTLKPQASSKDNSCMWIAGEEILGFALAPADRLPTHTVEVQDAV